VIDMAHPRMYSDDDPYLADVRRVCLALPEAVEKESWGRPTFRANKIFALFAGIESRPWGLVFTPDAEERPALLADEKRFYVPPYWGPGGGVALDLDAAPVDWDEVAELVESSYRRIALKRMLAALDARDGHGA
jgi:hypothetical protein